MFRPAVDWIRLMRLGNALVAGLGVWLGRACLRSGDLRAAWMGSAAMALLAAAANVHNDILDLEADRVNRPARALVTGRVSVSAAAFAVAGLGLFAVSAGFALDAAHGWLTAAMGLLLFLYNLRLKRWPLWGNLAVSLLCALAVYFLEFPDAPKATALPALFALLTTFARELAKDGEDMPGDKACGWNTFPLRFGEGAAAALTGASLALVLLLLPLPLLPPCDAMLGYGRLAYGLLALFPAALLLAALRHLPRRGRAWARIQRLIKWAMLAGMAAIVAGIFSPR